MLLRRDYGLLLVWAFWTLIGGCSSEPANQTSDGSVEGDAAVMNDGGGDDANPAWYQPDPLGRTTEGNIAQAEPEMLIVTSEALRSAWEEYALHRTLSGVLTRVVTVEELRTDYPAPDEAASVKAGLAARRQAGVLKYVLLGGDAEEVPFRRVVFGISIPFGASYSTNGPAELYFADLDTNWDANGNGTYGEKGTDISLQQMRGPEIGVGRVPASTADDVATYLAKAERYELGPQGRATYALLLSDETEGVPIIGTVDGAEGIEPTVSALFPESFKSHARRLYATSSAVEKYGGEILTPTKVSQALSEGFALSFHQGHGSHGWITSRLDASFVSGLQNELPTVFLSCACLSGNFADVADDPDYHNWAPQGPDSAAERFILGEHGAIAYVGNTAVGLGPIGGSQFLHALLEGMFSKGMYRIGEAFAYAHSRFRQLSLTMMGVSMPQTDDSEFWTHLAVVLLGDPALPVWTDEPRVATLDAPPTYGPGYNELTLTVMAGGAPLAGASVVAVKQGDFVLRGTTDAEGRVTFRFVPYGPKPLTIQASSPNVVPARVTVEPR